MKNLKRTLSLLVIILLIPVLTACSNTSKNINENNASSKTVIDKNINLNIMTTDKLLYSIVKAIVKDRHTLNYMFKDRISEINFKFTYDSLNNVSKKDLFIYVGSDFEPWIDSFTDKLNKNNLGVINSSRGVKFISYNKPVKYDDITINQNPYYFMDIDNYKVMLVNIKNAVEDKDPQSRSFYEQNFSTELKNLQTYQKSLKSVNENLSNYVFLTLNEDLAYFINYNKLNLLDTNSSYNNILPLDPNERASLQNKLNNLQDKAVLLYTSDSDLKNNYSIIKKYHIKTAKIMMFNGNYSYEDTLKYNINSLKGIYEKK
ncbi:MAG: zinc ABC transporter substrate-binding protein [Clostridium tyrobutyricum]|uniref:metal ABC transporter substrate-binding protein n=1 Tax=Clostridium tyrobutyricum TaxID=1519 RepID=UPI001F2D78B7|nr:zinc ABC transporter substrate-binding protein [Clostridium tyrobutyricum]MCH4201121.1 zinc ABC transporter substrate-binding protein [Clostridium tyrobutyricum]MCH4237144.1 zinc ABC transporter substrate-binding protein [Clostridium tyrobutyricum]MCH4260031.1 zinc ABC transporter substrate-binding protein [Clostridium tyrobutyricum]MCI1240331.1 zinc ABC transporter substrate-binding protein [Clostridium tyrobutyricum]MCI1651049.1 zinc ABC transporter substrate-binding protein [Clostridium 